jgi:tetratricopeptide (TPR) repeat protein
MRAVGHQWKGLYYSLMGRINDSLAELGTADTLARTSGNKSLADMILRDALWISYDWNRLDLYKSYLDKRMAYRVETKQGTDSLNRIYELLYTGLYDVKSGDVPTARKKLQEMEALSASIGDKEKEYNLLASNHLKREILFAEGNYDAAIKVFAEGPPMMIDLGNAMSVEGRNLPFMADFAAKAYLKKGGTDLAIEEYERLVSPAAKDREGALIHPFSRLRLAALYESKGDLNRALEQYKSLWSLWKQADPDLPEVATVRKKLALLKSRAPRPKGETVDAFYTLPFIGMPAGL